MLNNLKETENQIKSSLNIISEDIDVIQKLLDKKYQDKREEKEDYLKSAQLNIMFFLLLLIILSAIIYAGTVRYIFNPLIKVQDYTDKLKTGILPDEIYLKR